MVVPFESSRTFGRAGLQAVPLWFPSEAPGMSHTPVNLLYSCGVHSIVAPEPHGFSHEILLYGETKEKTIDFAKGRTPKERADHTLVAKYPNIQKNQPSKRNAPAPNTSKAWSASPRSSYFEDLQHLVAVMVDDLHGELARFGLGERLAHRVVQTAPRGFVDLRP